MTARTCCAKKRGEVSDMESWGQGFGKPDVSKNKERGTGLSTRTGERKSCKPGRRGLNGETLRGEGRRPQHIRVSKAEAREKLEKRDFWISRKS